MENQSIEEYIRESENIASLHNQIGDCDNILERMESMLTNFQVISWNFSFVRVIRKGFRAFLLGASFFFSPAECTE